MKRLLVSGLAVCLPLLTAAQTDQLSWEAEKAATPSPDFPYAGFWKTPDCSEAWGLAIAPSGRKGLYSVSFCGPGGCFDPGTYRPDTTLVNDRGYRIIDTDTIEVLGRQGFVRYVRCPGREVATGPNGP